MMGRRIWWWSWWAMAAVAAAMVVLASDEEREALLVFKRGVNGDPGGAIAGWSNSSDGDYCGWKGVECDNNNSRVVVAVDLTGESLNGVIEESAFVGGALAGLKVLRLGSNNFSGEIPQSLAELTSLEELRLDHNALEGIIPGSLAKLQNLTILDLSFNSLIGQIPQSLPFTAFNATSYAGNSALCGNPLSPCLGM